MLSHGVSDMRPNLLILGGTSQASRFAEAVARDNINATLSYAGRVERVKPQPIASRTGGFGGADGLADYIIKQKITHLIDATHPFAAQISRNAIAAAEKAHIRVCALTRPAWQPQQGDKWHSVATIDEAVAWLDRPAMRVMLAIGRQNLPAFEVMPQHHYLLRLVDPPASPPQFPHHHIVISRGPFDVESDLALIMNHQIEVIIAKNAGGDGASAKLEAARRRGVEVVMISRPVLPPRQEFTSIEAVMAWVESAG